MFIMSNNAATAELKVIPILLYYVTSHYLIQFKNIMHTILSPPPISENIKLLL